MDDVTHILNVVQFRKFITHAKPGATCQYYRGYLFFDRSHNQVSQTGSDAKGFLDLADYAFKLYVEGLVYLVQKKVGCADYCYLAIRTEQPASEGGIALLAA